MQLTKTFHTNSKLNKLLRLARTGKYSVPQLSKKFKCNKKTIYKAIKLNRICIPNLGQFKKRIYCNIEFFTHLSPVSAYWLGFIAADGVLSFRGNCVSITLNRKDVNHLYKFKNAIKTNAKVGFIRSNNSAHLTLYSDKLFSSLVDRGITPNKSLKIKKVKVPNRLMTCFIRGVFDGDGCISGKDISHVQFAIAGNKPFLRQLQLYLVKNLNINRTQIYKLTQSKAYKLQYTGTQIFYILNFLYKNSSSKTRLTRKYNKFLSLKRRLVKS